MLRECVWLRDPDTGETCRTCLPRLSGGKFASEVDIDVDFDVGFDLDVDVDLDVGVGVGE